MWATWNNIIIHRITSVLILFTIIHYWQCMLGIRILNKWSKWYQIWSVYAFSLVYLSLSFLFCIVSFYLYKLHIQTHTRLNAATYTTLLSMHAKNKDTDEVDHILSDMSNVLSFIIYLFIYHSYIYTYKPFLYCVVSF